MAEERVNHPKHYNVHPSGVECIDLVENLSFNIGNAIKYLWRAGHNGDRLEDLAKAKWYVERERLLVKSIRFLARLFDVFNDQAHLAVVDRLARRFEETEPNKRIGSIVLMLTRVGTGDINPAQLAYVISQIKIEMGEEQ